MHTFKLNLFMIISLLCFNFKAQASFSCAADTASEVSTLLSTVAKRQLYKGSGTITYFLKKEIRESITAELSLVKEDDGWNLVWEYCGKGYCSAESNRLELVNDCLQMDGQELTGVKSGNSEVSFTHTLDESRVSYKIKFENNEIRVQVSEYAGSSLKSTLTFTGSSR